MNCEYFMSFRRHAALMRTIHSLRKSRFFSLRPVYAKFNARSTDSLAERYSFDLVPRKPLAKANIFLRFSVRLFPRFALGISSTPYKFFARRLLRIISRGKLGKFLF